MNLGRGCAASAATGALTHTRGHIVVDGDYIAVHFTVTGTHLGAFQGIEATGRRVTILGFTFYRLEDRKFAEVWDHADMDAAMTQIGQGEAHS